MRLLRLLLLAGVGLLGAVPGAAAATFEGTLWHDRDDDGRRDAGEPPLANVPVHLLRADGSFIRGTTTGADGAYALDSQAVGATVTVEVVSGWFRSGCAYGAAACAAPDARSFPVEGERMLARAVVPAAGRIVHDAGLVPDWGDPGTPYPGPGGPFNAVDVAVRASAALSGCADPANRLCGLGQVARAHVQVFNQGTRPLRDVDVALTFDPTTMPAPGQPLVILRDAPRSAGAPAVTPVALVPFDAATHRAVVRLAGEIPPASAVTFDVPQLLVRGPLSPLPFATSGDGRWSKRFVAEAAAIGSPGPDVDAVNDVDATNDLLVGHLVNAPASLDEDDHDDTGFELAGYDLALRAEPLAPSVESGGSTAVTFTVTNQGDLPVADVVVTATLPAGAGVAGAATPR